MSREKINRNKATITDHGVLVFFANGGELRFGKTVLQTLLTMARKDPQGVAKIAATRIKIDLRNAYIEITTNSRGDRGMNF